MNGISWKGSNKQVEKQLVAQFENLGIGVSLDTGNYCTLRA